MAIYLFPWSVFLLCLPASHAQSTDTDTANLKRFLWMAWLAPLLFFSVSSAKANYYLVAVMPFAALHLALAIEQRDFLKSRSRALPGLLIALFGTGICIALVLRGATAAPSLSIMGMAQDQFLLVVCGGLALLAAASALVAWRQPKIGILAYLAVPVWCVAALFVVLMAVEPLTSTRPLARYLQSDLPGKSVYLYRNFEQQSSLPFYLKQPVGVIDSRSNDLFWGIKLRANDIAISGEEFGRRLKTRAAAVVVADRHLKDFKKTGFFGQFKGEKRIGELTVFYN